MCGLEFQFAACRSEPRRLIPYVIDSQAGWCFRFPGICHRQDMKTSKSFATSWIRQKAQLAVPRVHGQRRKKETEMLGTYSPVTALTGGRVQKPRREAYRGYTKCSAPPSCLAGGASEWA